MHMQKRLGNYWTKIDKTGKCCLLKMGLYNELVFFFPKKTNLQLMFQIININLFTYLLLSDNKVKIRHNKYKWFISREF